MNLEIKKDLVSNWFKTLQDAFCDDICKLEKNKSQFKSTNWKRNIKKETGRAGVATLRQDAAFRNCSRHRTTLHPSREGLALTV